MPVFVIFVEGADTEPPKVPVYVVESEEHASLICEAMRESEYGRFDFSFKHCTREDRAKFAVWAVMIDDAWKGDYGNIVEGIHRMMDEVCRVMSVSAGADSATSLLPARIQRPVTRGSPRRPPLVAFRAWYFHELLGIRTQQEIADTMTKQGFPATQGQVSKWLAAVEKYLKAGGLIPTVDELKKPETHTVDPAIIDMGARQDGRTPHQRPRQDDDADSWTE